MTSVVGVGAAGLESQMASAIGPNKSAQLEVAPARGLEQSNSVDAAAFAHAAGQPTMEVPAAVPSDAAVIQKDLGQRVESLSSHLAAWQKSSAAPHVGATDASGLTTAPTAIGSLTAQMRGAYTFAIETTLLSHGSTESTKIFNTLLKGQ